MAIKTQSQRLLLLLFPGDTRETSFVSFASAQSLFPQLTPAGFRSLVSHLQAKGLLHHERVGTRSQLYLSELGKTTLFSLFPAIDPARLKWTGSWACLVFQVAPKSDKQFRYLRRALVEIRAVQLTRGVYLYPGKFPPSFIEQCHRLYTGSISIFTVGTLQFGSFRPIVIEKEEMKTLQELYSGISSELTSLLGHLSDTALLTDQQKERFDSLFDRLLSVLRTDDGLGSYFFPEETWGEQVLQKFRAIVLL